MTRDDIRQAIFGISDGAATTIGAMFGLYALGATRLAILCAVLSAGLSATVSMGSAEYLSDDEASVGRAVMMTIGTAIGGIVPGLPFILTGGLAGLIIAVLLTAILGTWVAEARAHVTRRSIAYLQVIGTFTVVATLTYLLGVLLGG